MYNDNALKIGLFCMNISSGRYATLAEERWSASWEENLRAAQLSDAAGLDFLLPVGRWKGYGGQTDFQGSTFETLTWAAGMLAATDRITVFGTVHVPLFHPMIASKQMVTADHIGRGRFGLNIVAGWNDAEFGMYGVKQKEHAERYRQAQEWVDVVKRIWTEDDFDFDGDFYHMEGVRLNPKPYGGTQPFIMNAGISPDGRAFAMRNCDALFMAASYTYDDDSLAKAEADVANMKASARAIGREIDVYTEGSFICRPTTKEAHEYHHYLCSEVADWEAVDNILRSRGLMDGVPPDELERRRRKMATTSGGFVTMGSPDDIAANLLAISRVGFAGIGMLSPHYVKEFPYMQQELLPRLERLGLRMPTGAGA